MANKLKKMTIWFTDVEDQPGSTMGKFQALAESGADLQFVLARRSPERPGKGVLFVGPLVGKKQQETAAQNGFAVATDIIGVQVSGPNKKGLGHRLTRAIADSGINMRGLFAIVLGKNFSALFAFDNEQDADLGISILKKVK